MSDTFSPTATASTPHRRRGRALRKQIIVDGKTYISRDQAAHEVGISPRTAARKCRTGVTYVGGVAMVERDQALRDLVGLNPPRGRGRYRKQK